MLKELLTCKVALLYALLCELVHDLCLCGNGCMVSARHPTSVLSVKSRLADKDVLNSVVEHVSHVQDACDIRRWDNYRVRLSAVRLA